MKRNRLLTLLATAAVGVLGTVAAVVPMTASNAATACVSAYNSGTVYNGGMTASYNSHNWTAKWWTKGEAPSTGVTGVWQDGGSCDGGGCGGGGGTTAC